MGQVKRQVTHPLEALRLLRSEKGVGEANGVRGATPRSGLPQKKNKAEERRLASSLLQKHPKAPARRGPKTRGGYENIQLSAGDGSGLNRSDFRSPLWSLPPRLWYTDVHVRRRPARASWIMRCKKTKKSCVLWYLPTKSRKDNVSEVLKTTYKYQSVPDHPATATQLSY